MREDIARLEIAAAFLGSQIAQELRNRQEAAGIGCTSPTEERSWSAATDKGASSSPTASPGGREPLAS